MAITFTPEQEKVIQLHHRNILVSAAAGSGKTAVLVERIVRMITRKEDPVDIDRLLIVTFTSAAASEMRERISQRLALELKQYPDDQHIQKQMTLLHNAQITTIDSFCLYLIRNHFQEIGLDPAFRVADEGEIVLMQGEVLKEMLEEHYAAGEEDFTECVEFFCYGKREDLLEEQILKLSDYASSNPFPRRWLEKHRDDYTRQSVEEFLKSDLGLYLERFVRKILQGCRDKLGQIVSLALLPAGPHMYGEMAEKEYEAFCKITEQDQLERVLEGVTGFSFGRLSSVKDASVDPVLREQAKKLREEVKDTLKKVSADFYALPFGMALEKEEVCGKPVRMLVDLTLEYDRKMRARKQQEKVIDFADMEHYALEILYREEGGEMKPSSVAKEYRSYFKEILIDEYQDSNLVQEYLLKAISGEEQGHYNLFMVGDVKQSIYRFRLARPELFLEKYRTYQEEGTYCCRIDLSRNFRSRREVVDTVNSIFRQIMTEDIGGIPYDEKAALYTGAEYPEGQDCESELILVEKPGSDEEESTVSREALAIARRIKELKKNFQVQDAGTRSMRPVRYSDMVILLRATSGWDEAIHRVLEEEGIPSYITSKTGYFSATEVQELLQVLKTLDNPRQDIPLFCMLKSVFGGFTQEEIALLRGCEKHVSLYETLVRWAEADCLVEEPAMLEGVEPEKLKTLHEKAADFLEKLNHYRRLAVYTPIRELLELLVEEQDYLNYVTALPAGEKRRANVEMLFTKASDFEKTSYSGLFHFVRYMEQLEKYDVDYGEADLLDENADVVRIMSIHKSKGLEFPVTFVAGLSKRFHLRDYSQDVVMDVDAGIGVPCIRTKERLKSNTLRQKIVAQKLREDNYAEELRILYVALTRAKEKLILTASVRKADKILGESEAGEEKLSGLSYQDYINAVCYLDFLLPVLPGTKLKLKTVGGEQLQLSERQEQVEYAGLQLQLEHPVVDPQLYEQIKKRFLFVYPYENEKNLYTKTTVSELKIAAMADKDEAAFHSFEEKEIVPYIPSFRQQEEKVSGATRGSAFHRAMELMDFQKVCTVTEEFPDYGQYRACVMGPEGEERLQKFLEQECSRMRLSKEYLAAVNQEKLLHFLASEYGYRMWKADREGALYREQPFVLGIAANRVSQEFPAQEKVLIQGIIDVFWVEEGSIVLLDYKTDVIASMQDLWNRYETQIAYYKEAIEKIMQMPVKESVLYSFFLEQGTCMELSSHQKQTSGAVI